jgi:hypothetical protein
MHTCNAVGWCDCEDPVQKGAVLNSVVRQTGQGDPPEELGIEHITVCLLRDPLCL